VKLTEIVFTNSIIKQGLAKGTNTQALMVQSHRHRAHSRRLILIYQEQWETLQLAVAMYVNSELPGVPVVPVSGNINYLQNGGSRTHSCIGAEKYARVLPTSEGQARPISW
jgi:hypothetical protein